jgi:cytochrome b6-f complex iron-sulfur subunit
MDSNLTRRRFLETSVALLGLSLAGCGDAPAPVAFAVSDGSFMVKGVEKIPAGSAVAFTFPNGEPGLIFTTADGKTAALSAKCTHAGCTVEWEGPHDTKAPLRCPCHESEFALDGQVLSGPARVPLTRFIVASVGKELLLKRV